MDTDRKLAALAASQHGVFSTDDARALGVSSSTIMTRRRSGRYVRLHPGVYAVAGSTDTDGRRMVAAVKSFPMLTAISHRTAAGLWGLTRRDTRHFDIVTVRWDRVHRPDLDVHESLDLLDEDVTELDGIPLTTPARTIVDLGAVNRWAVEHALEQGIRNDLFTLADVDRFVRRVARRGRRGVGVIRPLLEARLKWDRATESALEDEFRKLIADWGLPMPELQYEVRDKNGFFVCRADFAYPDRQLLVELDSEAHHLDRITFRRDREKQNRAVILGWTVLRYTWWDLKEHPIRVVSELEAKLADPSVPA